MLYIFKFNDTMFEHHIILVFRRKLKSSRTEEEGDVKDFRIVVVGGEGGGELGNFGTRWFHFFGGFFVGDWWSVSHYIPC